MSFSRCDLAIVGGGILGLATAFAVRQRAPGASIVVLEKESRTGTHQTGHNSGVIHAGIYYTPGSYKAKLCVEGVRLLKKFCDANGVAYEDCGKVIVATNEEEVPRLRALHERGTANGVPGLTMIGPERLRELEPQARAVAALHSPHTAIVDYGAVMQAARDEVVVRTNAALRAVHRADGMLHLQTAAGEVAASNVVNCSGLFSDRVARLMGAVPDVRIIPFRGEYYTLRREQSLVRGLIYPVPDPNFPFLGVHFTKRIQGDFEAGPNAVLAFAREGYRWRDVNPAEVLEFLSYAGFWRMAAKYGRMGLYEFYRSLSRRAFLHALQRLVPALQADDLEPGGSGVRAQAVAADGSLVDDFRIVESANAVHVLNAPSPAATASLAIGRHIAGLAAERFGLE
jgi:L-2-hydroxyglutarate oxidase LhgO